MDCNLRRVLTKGVLFLALCSSSAVFSQVTPTGETVKQMPHYIHEGQNFELKYLVLFRERPSNWQNSYLVNGFNIVLFEEVSPFTIGAPIPPRHTPFSQSVLGLPAGVYDIYTATYSSQVPLDYVIPEGKEPQGSVIIHPGTINLQMGLGSPKADDVVGGFGVIRGWACYTKNQFGIPAIIGNVSYQVDNGNINPVPYGSSRGDVTEPCGGKLTTAGFAAPTNWNRFSLGTHTFRLYVDGEEVINHDVIVSGTGETYLRGLEAEYILDNFPDVGATTTIEWSQPAQDFTIIGVERE